MFVLGCVDVFNTYLPAVYKCCYLRFKSSSAKQTCGVIQVVCWRTSIRVCTYVRTRHVLRVERVMLFECLPQFLHPGQYGL